MNFDSTGRDDPGGAMDADSSAPETPAPALQMFRHGILFVVSAPSGAGKSTLLNSLRQTPDFIYSVSCTTRPPRPGEIDGEDYHFISPAEFARRLEADEFLEHAEVHGHRYGTLRASILDHLNAGVDVLVDVDVQGAHAIRDDASAEIRKSVADIFIMPPSFAELRRRLTKRGTETSEQIEIRLRNAATEMEAWRDYRYTLISGSVEEDLQKFRAIIRAERYLSSRMILTP